MAKSPDRILDEILVLRCQSGDVVAFQELVSRWHPRLRRHAWYLTEDPEATGEIVQDAWLDIIRSIRRLEEPASFRGWAYRIVGNKAVDWVRRNQRQRALYREVSRQQSSNDKLTALDELEDGPQSLLRHAVRTLPVSCQLILSLKYVDRMSTREIADTLEIPAGTVKSRLHHARERLKQVLQRMDQ